MVEITIRDSVPEDALELIYSLREEDRLEAVRAGLDANESPSYNYKIALYRKTALIDGKIAAMWGVCGTPLTDIGWIYLVTGKEVLNISPIKFARIYKKEASVMNKLFPVLQNYVDAKYTGAVRLLELSGFKLEGPIILNENSFYKFTMVRV